jgi:jumonji domain-containing protein 2
LKFWKNIAFSPPLYGADLLNTLMDESSKGWNLNTLDCILMDAISDQVKGVNTPYCYVGSWKALFCWHTEDLDLSAINFLHLGKPKFWYAIHQDDRHII